MSGGQLTQHKPHLYRLKGLRIYGDKRTLRGRWIAGVGKTPVEAHRDYLWVKYRGRTPA
jgi:hypothetical protein